INFSIIGIVPWKEFVPPTDPPAPVASMLMAKIYSPPVARVFTILVLATAVGSVFALLLGYSRIPYAAARDGYFFKVFGRLHPTGRFPYISLLLIGLIAMACCFVSLQQVIDALIATRIVIQFMGQIVAITLLRKHKP